MNEPAARDDFPKLEKYELVEEIGHGGMATVYRARDVRLKREVAVKIIHRHLRENREVATRFIAEARAAAKLKHRGIVEVYDVSSEEDRERYLVVELVRGHTLRKVLLDHREMPPEIGAAIVAELCDAIEHAHASGIIHRDVKPENVLVGLPKPRDSLLPSAPVTVSTPPPSSDRPSGDEPVETSAAEEPPRDAADEDDVAPNKSSTRKSAGPPSSGPGSGKPASRTPRSRRKEELSLKITDFGIAKILDAHGVTSTGQVLGSPAHMAPEQIEGGEVDQRTDVFALGVILYECLVGHLPFDGKNPAQVLRRVLDGRYERAELERPVVGARFSSIADRALAMDMADRPETPAALAALLREELEALGLSDGRQEITEYFRDPDGYREKLTARLVPLLVARAENARRAKRNAEAAMDFNRAHALAPDDVAILKRLTQLGSSRSASALWRKVGLLSIACVVLGGGAYGAVRALRGDPTELSATEEHSPTSRDEQFPPVRNPVLATPRVATAPAPSALASSSASASPSSDPALDTAVRPGPSSTASALAVAGSGERRVRFVVQPRGASLEVDGSPLDHAQAVPYVLKVGSHSAKITPAAGDKSCEPGAVSLSFPVHALKEGEPDKPQIVQLSLKFKPARVKLAGPEGGQAVCGAFRLNVGASQDIPMTQPVWDGTCKFLLSGKEKSALVTIKAGEDNTVGWPMGG